MKVTQWCPTVWNPMDCSLPGFSIHGILQARVLEWVANLVSRESSQPRDCTQVSHIESGFFTVWATREADWLELFFVCLRVLWKKIKLTRPLTFFCAWPGLDFLIFVMFVYVCVVLLWDNLEILIMAKRVYNRNTTKQWIAVLIITAFWLNKGASGLLPQFSRASCTETGIERTHQKSNSWSYFSDKLEVG